MGDLSDALLTRLHQDGWAALISASIPGLNTSQRETALALAAHLVRADRQVKPVEEHVLSELVRQMEFADGRGEQIVEVIAVLHRDALV